MIPGYQPRTPEEAIRRYEQAVNRCRTHAEHMFKGDVKSVGRLMILNDIVIRRGEQLAHQLRARGVIEEFFKDVNSGISVLNVKDDKTS